MAQDNLTKQLKALRATWRREATRLFKSANESCASLDYATRCRNEANIYESCANAINYLLRSAEASLGKAKT